MSKRQRKTDARIAASWERHNTDDISTERLFAMVSDDTGCDTDRIIEAMVRLGHFQPVKPK